MERQFEIELPEGSAAERSKLATSLQDTLKNIQGVKTDLRRENPETQDPGTILSIVLGAPAVVAVVRAIASWLVRTNQGSITVTRTDGRVVVRNLDSKDVPDAIRAIEAALED